MKKKQYTNFVHASKAYLGGNYNTKYYKTLEK